MFHTNETTFHYNGYIACSTRVTTVLTAIYDRLCEDDCVKQIMHIDYSMVTSNVAMIDLNEIGNRIESAAYRDYEAFLSDVKWIVDNIEAFFLVSKSLKVR